MFLLLNIGKMFRKLKKNKVSGRKDRDLMLRFVGNHFKGYMGQRDRNSGNTFKMVLV